MIKKGELILLVLFAFLLSITYVVAVPPPPPNITINPPTYCNLTNGGVEICDSIDNDCDGSVDENAATEVCDSIDNDCDGSVDEEDVCTNPTCSAGSLNLCITSDTCAAAGGYWYDGTCHSSPQSSGGGGGGGGGGSRPSTTTTTNTTNTTNTTVAPIINNTSVPEKVVVPIVNNSLVEIIPIADKIENLSNSETNEKIHRTLMGYNLTNVIIVGAILMAMIVFISIFILDYSRKRQRMKDEKILQSVSASGTQQDKKKETDYSGLSPQETQAMKYIEGMRAKGFKDDYTRDQLKGKGWKDNVLNKLFK